MKEKPSIEELKSFWSNIKSHNKSRNKKAREIEIITYTYKIMNQNILGYYNRINTVKTHT